MRMIRVTAMVVLAMTALGVLAQGCVSSGTDPAAKGFQSTVSTKLKPGEERVFAGMAFVWVPPGSFMMGSPETEEGRNSDEGPQHKVTFAEGFWMGKYEVTQGEWQAVMGNNPSRFKGSDRLPVDSVSWNECQAFIEKLDAKGEGTFRLPSEAEWEYACRAGTTTPFHFGETITTDQVNYSGCHTDCGPPEGVFREKTTEVGSFPANAWGLHDMHGNVFEWCQDCYHDNYDGAPTDGSAWESPASDYRVVRGGAWSSLLWHCRAAGRRLAGPMMSSGSQDGFRLVCSPPTPR